MSTEFPVEEIECHYGHWSFLKDCKVDSIQFVEGENVGTVRYGLEGFVTVVRENEPHDIVTVPLTFLKSRGAKHFSRKWYKNLNDSWVKSMADYKPTVDDLNKLAIQEGEEVFISSFEKDINGCFLLVRNSRFEKGYVPYHFLDPNPVPPPPDSLKPNPQKNQSDHSLFAGVVVSPSPKNISFLSTKKVKNRSDNYLFEGSTQKVVSTLKENINPVSTNPKNE